MSTGKRVLLIVLALSVVGVLAGVGIYNASRREDEAGIPRSAIPVSLENPHRQTITSRVSAKGSVELLDRTTVYPSTQAQIATVHVRAGDEVQAGDLIVTYDPKTLETYQDQLAEAQLGLKTAELALSAARIPPARAELLQAEAQIKQAEKATRDIDAQVKQIELNLDQLNASLSTAEKRAADTQTLFTMGVATQTEVDGAKDAVTSLQGQLDGVNLQLATALSGIPMAEETVQLAQAQYNTLANRLRDPRTQNQLETLEVNIEQMNLRIGLIQKSIDDFTHAEYAPVSGTVLTLLAAEGDIAANGRPLMELADISLDNLVIRINIPEGDAKNISLDQPAEIKGAALGTDVFAGHVSKISPLAEMKPVGNGMETVITVEITPDDDRIRLRAGYSIDTNIVTGVQENALVAPLMSTLSDEDGHFVYVMAEDYTVKKKYITLGEYAGLYVQVDGAAETDRVVLNPSNQIREGVYVRPITAQAGQTE